MTTTGWLLVSLVLSSSSGAVAQADRSGVRPEVLSLPSGPGSIEGLGESFDPSPNTGTSSYRVPISVPPGVNGFTPSLALGYSSGSGNGELGLGWSLGLPVVQRATHRGLPRYESSDTIVVRGLGGRGSEELVALPDGSWRFRIEGGLVRGRRRADGSWELRSRSGARYRFGATETSTIRQGEVVFAWLLTEQEDAWGNRITYEHSRDETGRPYLSRIVYNDFGPRHRNELDFVWEERPDVLTSYVATFPVTLARRLARIEARHGGELLRSYELGYRTMMGVSRLEAVQLTGRHGDSLPALRFRYAELVSDAARVVTMTAGPARALGDVTEIDDVDGDGLPDLLVMDPSTDGGRYAWYPNLDGVGWGPRTVMATSPSVWLASDDVQLADMDGDGSADVVARVSSAADGFRYYPGGDSAGFGPAVTIRPNASFGFEDPDVRLVDLDHDGRTDLLRIDPTTGRVSVAFNQGGGAFTELVLRPRIDDAEVVAFSRGSVHLADMNGDGLLDLVAVRSGSLRYWPSMGFGYFDSAVVITGAPSLSDTELGESQVRDLNGDGLADLVHAGVRSVRYWLSLAASTLLPAMSVDETPERRPTTVTRVADMNGNGTADVVWVDPADPSAPWRYLDVLGDGTPGLLTSIDNGLGRTTTIEYAGIGEMRAWARDNGVEWSRRCPVGQTLVASVSVDDGLGSVTTTLYRYADGYYDGLSREARGFARAFRFDTGDREQPTLFTEQVYDVGDADEALAGMLLADTRMTEEGEVFDITVTAHEVRTVDTAADGTPVRLAHAVASERRVHEGTGEPAIARTEWSYDDYGNVTREAQYGLVDGDDTSFGDDERIVERTFATDVSRWVLDRVATEVTTDLEGRRLAETRTYYDGPAFEGLPLGNVERGAVARVEAWIADDRWAQVERVEHDEHGNVVAQLDARGGRVEVDFDRETHTFVVAERRFVDEAAHLAWTADWDRALGKVTRVVDPNGHEQRFGYDGLGRLVWTVLPGDSEELPTARYEYRSSAPLSVLREERREVSGGEGLLTRVTHVDGLGRTRIELSEAGEGKWATSGLSSYGARGWVRFSEHASLERSADWREPNEASGGTWTTYDAVGRPLTERAVDGAERRSEYEPHGVRIFDENDTDPASRHHDTPTTRIEDGLGRLREVIERDGPRAVVTRYSYDAVDNLTSVVDAENRVRLYHYDGLSRRIRIEDPNAGEWVLAYDDAGSLIERRDPEGHVVDWTHDLLGRVVEEHYTHGSDGQRRLAALHHYDAASADHPELGNLAGELGWVADEAGIVYFGYDARGRQTDRIRRWEDGTEHATWSDFDAAGRPVRRGYPDGSYLPFAYDERGLLRSAGPILTDVRWTAWGGLASVTFGNGVVDRRTYDARQRLRGMHASDRDGRALRDLTLDRDAASRITAIVDGRPGVDPMLDLGASYVFDDRYRLIEATDSVATTMWIYDDVANVLAVRSGHAAPFLNVDNTYGAEGAGPDQLTRFGDERIRYDRAGRVVEDGTRRLFWDAKGRLARVERGDIVEEYVYAFDDTRTIKRTVTPAGTQVTRYVDSDVEERAGELVRYVFLGDTRVARLDRLPDAAGAPRIVAPLEPPRAAIWAVALFLLLVQLARRAPGRHARAPLYAVSLLAACGTPDPNPRDTSDPITQWPAGAVVYLTDHAGSVLTTITSDALPAEESAYHPYGTPRAIHAADDPWGYIGNEADSTGLGDFHARPYRAEMARFLAVDPVPLMDPDAAMALPARFQAYTYAGGDPLNQMDPDGQILIAISVGGEGGGGEGRTVSAGLWIAADLNGIRVGWQTTSGRGPRSGPGTGAGMSGGINGTVQLFGNESDYGGRADTMGISAGPAGGEIAIPKRSPWWKSAISVGLPGMSGGINADGIAGYHYSTRTETGEDERLGASAAEARVNETRRREEWAATRSRRATRACEQRRQRQQAMREGEQITQQYRDGRAVSVDAAGVVHEAGSLNMSVADASSWPTAWPRR